MSFLYPYVLIALVLPLALAGLGLWLRHRNGKAWRKLVSPAHRHELVHEPPFWRTVTPAVLALLALACTILAAARPINGYSESGAVAAGRNLIIALDISRSMETKDVSPSRLEQAKAAAVELIQALPTDKIGLIVFSGEADMVVPLTYDHNALLDTLSQVDRTWIEYGGTNIAFALNRALQDFKRSSPDGTNAIVLLSDGEETEDETLQAIAQKARSRNMLVISVGVGTTTGDTIPDARGEGGLWQDASGRHVISKLQPQTLRKLAEETGGDFVVLNSGTNLTDFARHAAAKIDRHEEEAAINKVPNDLFAYFAATALLLVVVSILLATDWRLPRRAAAALLALALFGAPQAMAEDAEVEEEEDTQAAERMSYAEHYAAGMKYLQEKKVDKAKEAFSRALLSPDAKLQAAVLHALGNIGTQATFSKLRGLYEPEVDDDEDEESKVAGKLAESPSITPEALQDIADQLKKDMGVYQDALKADPKLAAARNNADKIQRLINALDKEIKHLQQQEEEQQQQEQEGQDDKQQQQQNQQQKGQQQQQNQQQQQGQQQQQQNQQQQGQQGQQQQQQNQQQNQQQQGQQDKQQQQQGQQQDQQQDKQDQQQEGQQDQEQQDQADQQEQKDNLDDLIDSLKDEIDKLKQQQQEKRSPEERKQDAQDLIDSLKDELDKLKNENEGKDGKDKQDRKDKQDKKNKKNQDAQKDLDDAKDLAKDLQKELERMRDEAEQQDEDLSPEDQQELDEANKLIRNLQDEINKLKAAMEEQDREKDEQKEEEPALSPEKEKERAEQRAESLLRMSLDEEDGSPIPHAESQSRRGYDRNRRPAKDY